MSDDRRPSSVAVIDDNDDWCFLVELALAGDGRFSFAGGAADGATGVRLLGEVPVDVVLVDLGLCGGKGDVVRRIRGECPACAVVVTSAHAPMVAVPAVDGGIGYLSKGTPPSRLGDELDRLAAMLHIDREGVAVAATVLPAERHSIREARQFVGQALQQWGVPDLLDIATLLVSEVATNAVLHAGSSVDLVLQLDAHRLRVVVADDSSDVLRRRVASEGDSSGRGIEMVEALSAAWGIDVLPGGKRVWFELERP